MTLVWIRPIDSELVELVQSNVDCVPRLGDEVVIEGERYRVRALVWKPGVATMMVQVYLEVFSV